MSYWDEYNALQYYKHKILKDYLAAWFPILSSFKKRIIYFDCFAGQGRHSTGDLGSPLLALNILLNHNKKNKILNSTEVIYVFIEKNKENTQSLIQEIKTLDPLHKNIKISIFNDDYESRISHILDNLESRQKKLAPSFFFVDPFGFKISLSLLNRMIKNPKSELLINFMYRYILMAITVDQENNMNNLFGCTDWKKFKEINDVKKREEGIIELFTSKLKCNFTVNIPFLGVNDATKYYLIHASNHETAVEKMKDSIWRTIPNKQFYVSERENHKQVKLFEPNLNLRDLEEWIWDQYANKKIYVEDIYSNLLSLIYKKKHLHDIIREYRKRKIIKCTEYGDRFAFSRNPLLHFPEDRTYINPI